jgi:hypothetical protein
MLSKTSVVKIVVGVKMMVLRHWTGWLDSLWGRSKNVHMCDVARSKFL